MYSSLLRRFHDKNFPQDLKAKALQYVTIPMFAVSFDKEEGDQVRLNIEGLFCSALDHF